MADFLNIRFYHLLIFLHSLKFLLNELLINFKILPIYIFLSDNIFHFCLTTCFSIGFNFQAFKIFLLVCIYARKFEFIKIIFIKINFIFLLVLFSVSILALLQRLFDKFYILTVNNQLWLLLLL